MKRSLAEVGLRVGGHTRGLCCHSSMTFWKGKVIGNLTRHGRLHFHERGRICFPKRFLEFLQAPRQPFVDALGVVVVRRGGHGARVRMAGTWVAYSLVVASHELICRKKCELFQFDHPTLL